MCLCLRTLAFKSVCRSDCIYVFPYMAMCVFSVNGSEASHPKGNYSITDTVTHIEENIKQFEIVFITATGPLF